MWNVYCVEVGTWSATTLSVTDGLVVESPLQVVVDVVGELVVIPLCDRYWCSCMKGLDYLV
tara:strand:- start:624 stop:806 length:183 start_codon:yes stop_codon:yes gene_type:complete